MDLTTKLLLFLHRPVFRLANTAFRNVCKLMCFIAWRDGRTALLSVMSVVIFRGDVLWGALLGLRYVN